MQSVTLLGTELSSPTSGQARFLYNMARGLSATGVAVSVVLYGEGGERARRLESAGVRVSALGHDPSSRSGRFRRMTRLNEAGEVVAAEVRRQDPTTWYVVLSDDLVSAVRGRFHGRWAYLSNGDMALLLLNRTFVGADRLPRELVGLGAADLLRSHARDAERYDLLLANSGFTRQLMSYLYGVPFQGAVYPPVDVQTFHPGSASDRGEFVLAVARNRSEQGLPLIADIARDLPVRVVGGAHVDGATSLGTVPDEELADLYRKAAFLAFPALSEPFGYAVAESLCCGTPALTFDIGGPGELVRLHGGGWTVGSTAEFVDRGRRPLAEVQSTELRRNAASAAAEVSIDASARALAAYLRISPPPGPSDRTPA